MRCPRDGSTLVEETVQGVEKAQICPACGGVWLHRDELERLEKAYAERTPRIPPEWDAMTLGQRMAEQKNLGPGDCPVCDETLVQEEYAHASSVMVDVCTHGHGLWLDKGELLAIEEFYAREHAEARSSFLVEFPNLLGRRWT